MQCVVLAGGRATRLGSLAAEVPKHLVPVAGRPFADHQLEWLRSEGVEEVVYCIGHLGDMIEDHVGDGSRWGLRIAYVRDGPQLVGTGGALRRAADADVLAPWFFVTYGDSYLRCPLESIRDRFLESRCPALMTVYENADRYDASNVVFADGRIELYDKTRPPLEVHRMRHIDYGLQVLQRAVLERIRPDRTVDLADLLHDLSVEGQLAGYLMTDRFYEIGTPEGLRELDLVLRTR